MAEINYSLASRPAGKPGASAALLVATVFEDDTTALCARRLIGRILRTTRREIRVEEDFWAFALLEQPDGLAAAGRRAGAADVLVVAAWRDSAALLRVIDWLQHWLAPRRTKPGALVFISVEREEAALGVDPIGERLTHVARQIGMDFFSTQASPAAELLRLGNTTPAPHESKPRRYFPTRDQPHPDCR